MRDILLSTIGDLRVALRQLRQTRALSIAAITCLGLGIGANTAIFSVVDAVLFRPLPFREPGRLVVIGEELPKFGGGNMGHISAPDFLDFHALDGRVFESSAIVDNSGATVSGPEGPERVTGALVSSSLLHLLGVKPMLGRDFLPSDDSLGAADVVMLSSGMWARRFNRDPNVAGRAVVVNGRSATIIGVTPDGFSFPPYGLNATPAELFAPYRMDPDVMKTRGIVFNTLLLARLRPGVSPDQATREINTVASGIQRNHPEIFSREGVQITAAEFPLHDRLVGDVRRSLLVLSGSVGFVLLIACIDVSSLLLARAAARTRELALRTALGATRGRLIRQFLAESFVLVSAGLALGLVIAQWGTKALTALAPRALLQGYKVGIDGRVLGVSVLIAIVTALVFSLVPALQRSHRGIAAELHDESRSSAGRARHRGRRGLVVSQIALALVVTTGAGLLIKSFVRARNIDPGFDPQRVLSFRLIVPQYRYRGAGAVQAIQRRVIDRLAQIPGVVSASAGSYLPMAGAWRIAFTPEGRPLEQTPIATNNIVLPGFFETLGIRFVAGRPFTEHDGANAPPVAIINETLARRFYPDQDPLGKRLKWGSAQSRLAWRTIVGVVRDVKERSLDEETEPGLYFAALQEDTAQAGFVLPSVAVVARTSADPMSLSGAVRRALREIDPELPLANLTDAATVTNTSVASRRFNVLLLAGFAALALVLAAVGIYGLMAYSVVRRHREIGVRLAIGATPGGVLRLVVGEGFRMALLGIGIGIAGALGLTRSMQKLLFGVSPLDAGTFVAATAVLLTVCLAASWLPAWRASRVDPAVAMRGD